MREDFSSTDFWGVEEKLNWRVSFIRRMYPGKEIDFVVSRNTIYLACKPTYFICLQAIVYE